MAIAGDIHSVDTSAGRYCIHGFLISSKQERATRSGRCWTCQREAANERMANKPTLRAKLDEALADLDKMSRSIVEDHVWHEKTYPCEVCDLVRKYLKARNQE